MIRKLLTVFSIVLITTSMIFAQNWQNDGAWPDETFVGGAHGIAVSPDGKVWQASYFKTNWVTPDGDTILTSPIIIFNADGSVVDTIHTITTQGGSVVDTLGVGGSTSGCRGMAVDADGNILYTSGAPSKMLKINYQTLEGMASVLIGDDIGSSPTAPSVTESGAIYVGPVVGNGSDGAAIAIYDKDLVFQGKAVVGPPAIARTMEVSPDGNTIYWTPFTGIPKIYIYTKADEFSAFELTDSLFEGMSIESSAWHPVTGDLWVSHDSRGDSTYTHLTWYGIDLTTNSLVDSFSLASQEGVSDEFPRALDFSPDGSAAYVSLFGTAFNRIYKFTDLTVDVELVDDVVPSGYMLEQNYPNPFNPATTISFSIPKSEVVTLKIYDMLGREISTLINEVKSAGVYNATFDASRLASGTYIYSLRVGDFQQSKKMTLIK